MNEKIVDWLSEKFGAELKDRIPSSALVAAIIGIILTWASEEGVYKSALLGVLTLAPTDLTNEHWGIGQISFFIYIIFTGGALIFYPILKLAVKGYFKYVCSLPKYRNLLENMSKDLDVVDDQRQTLTLMLDLRSAESELEKRRKPVRTLVEVYYWLVLIGLVLMSAAIQGNRLDFFVGLTCVIVGFYTAFRSVGIFLASVTPWHAQVKALNKRLEFRAHAN